jgi:hypothetical protein
MYTNKKIIIALLIVLLTLFICSDLFAANIYVDSTLGSNCTSGRYSVVNRNCSGSDGNAYNTIQVAINAMSPGDTIYMRGGTYNVGRSSGEECIDIPISKNGSGWTKGNYNTLASYPGEWAIIDGQNNCGNRGVGLGHYAYGEHGTVSDIKYWLFERFEITNARSSDGSFSKGFHGNGGPFKFRYLYIHDNQASSGGNNPGGLSGQHWQNSLVEFSWLKNNGTAGHDPGHNATNIVIYSDYNETNVANDGFNPNNSTSAGTYKNEIRYNLLQGSTIGFKHKSGQLLSRRKTSFQETYDEYGDKIHHNIVQDTYEAGIDCSQDFGQVYNNILNNCARGISVEIEDVPGMYKVVVYNNTIIDPAHQGIARFAWKSWSWEIAQHHGWDYNNILVNSASYNGYCSQQDISVCYSPGDGWDLSNYYNSYNYFYSPNDSNLISLGDSAYTTSGWESQSISHTPREVYTSSGNSPFLGTSGANKYITNGSFIVERSTTIANGGSGGSHPYLNGVNFPSYIGATNPNDNAWVSGVLGLSNVEYLKNGGSDDPTWIEGGSGSAQIPPAIPTSLKVSME